MKKSYTRTLAYSGIFLALLIVLQFVTKPLGQLVTGSCVNFVLVASAVLGGGIPAIAVAFISPFLAFALGIGPMFIQLVPMIAIGNLVIVACYLLIFKNDINPSAEKWIISVIVSSVLKFLALYVGVVKIILPLIANIKPPQVKAISTMFTFPQLITALIGGAVAFAVVPSVKKALDKKN